MNTKPDIEGMREETREQSLRRQWTVEEGKAKAPKPMRYDLLEAIDKAENGEPLTRNERRILIALDKQIEKAEKRKTFKESRNEIVDDNSVSGDGPFASDSA